MRGNPALRYHGFIYQELAELMREARRPGAAPARAVRRRGLHEPDGPAGAGCAAALPPACNNSKAPDTMANLRILHDNAANRVSSLSASTTSGSLAAANLLTDRKAEVHRATATSVTYTATWASPELMSMVALAFTNYTSTATIRVRAYTLAADVSPAVDTGAVLACGYSLWPLALGHRAARRQRLQLRRRHLWPRVLHGGRL